MSSSESEAFESADEDSDLQRKVKSGKGSANESPENKKETTCEKQSNFSKGSPDADGWDVDGWSGNNWGDFDDPIESSNVKTTTKIEPKKLENIVQSPEVSSPQQKEEGIRNNPDKPELVETNLEQSKNTASYGKENVPDFGSKLPEPGSTWGWKPWSGVVSFLSTASEGVSNLTSHVSQGFSTVIESNIGAPEPEEMARMQLQEDRKAEQCVAMYETDEINREIVRDDSKDDLIRNSLGIIVSGVTQIGSKVITGGLDTLEGIGKKTMTILQDNDPLLRNKRKFLGLDNEKPVLSQMLREAKEKSEETEKNLKQMQKHMYKKQVHFETLFDHFHGLVHLEALEMLSKQSSIKLRSLLEPLTGKALEELQETLNEVQELCDLGDLERDETDGTYDTLELEEKFRLAKEDLDIEVDLADLIRCWKDNTAWLNENENVSGQEVYEKALNCLAETTALAVHKMHKIAEMLLIKDHHSTANEADSLIQLTTTFCWHLVGISNRFAGKLNSFQNSEENSSLITTIFLEESNSTSYVQSAFQLFIPILQIGAA